MAAAGATKTHISYSVISGDLHRKRRYTLRMGLSNLLGLGHSETYKLTYDVEGFSKTVNHAL